MLGTQRFPRPHWLSTLTKPICQLYCSVCVDAHWQFRDCSVYVLHRRPEVFVNGLFSAVSNKANKRPNVAVIGWLEMLVVLCSPFDWDNDWRIGCLHQNQVHQKSACATVAVVEWVNVNQSVVGKCRHLHRMKAQSFLGVQPVHKLTH